MTKPCKTCGSPLLTAEEVAASLRNTAIEYEKVGRYPELGRFYRRAAELIVNPDAEGAK